MTNKVIETVETVVVHVVRRGFVGLAIRPWPPSSGQRDTATRPKEREKAPGVREGSDLSGSGDLTYERTVPDRYRMYIPRRVLSSRCFDDRRIPAEKYGSIGCSDVPVPNGLEVKIRIHPSSVFRAAALDARRSETGSSSACESASIGGATIEANFCLTSPDISQVHAYVNGGMCKRV